MTVNGLDYAYGRPDPAAILTAGYRFVVRYLSTKDNPKNLTAAEARAYLAAGVDVVTVFERTPTRPLGGMASGGEDGRLALSQAAAVGAPARAAIYAAVDFDASAAQMPTVLLYLDAFADAIRPRPAGVYGGHAVIAACADRFPYLWQAAAWSHGAVHPGAHLLQHFGQVTIDGVTCDTDTATVTDYGGWLTQEGDGVIALDENDPVTKRIIASLTRIEDQHNTLGVDSKEQFAKLLAAIQAAPGGTATLGEFKVTVERAT